MSKITKKEKMKTLIQVFALFAIIITLAAVASLKLFYQAETKSVSIDISLADAKPVNDLLYGTQINLSNMGSGVLKMAYSQPGALFNQRAVRPLEFDDYIYNKAKDLNLPVIRWGVNNVFDWRSTIGPIDQRPMRYFNKSRAENFHPDPQTFGTDEVIWFGRSQNPDMQFSFILPIIHGVDESRLYIDGAWQEDVATSHQSNANLVEYVNGEASSSIQQKFLSGQWQASEWITDLAALEAAKIAARDKLYPNDPSRPLNADHLAALEKTYLIEDCDQIRSWCSWQEAPAGYFAGLRWHFASLRAEDGESYLLDGSAYNVRYWEYGNEVHYRGPTRANRPFAQPKIYGDSFQEVVQKMKLVDPSVIVSPTIWGTVSSHMMWNEGYVWNFGSAKMTPRRISRQENILTVRIDKTSGGVKKQLPTDQVGTLLKLSNFNTQTAQSGQLSEYHSVSAIREVNEGGVDYAEYDFLVQGSDFEFNNQSLLSESSLSIEGLLGPVAGVRQVEALTSTQARVWLEPIERGENTEDYYSPFAKGDMITLENSTSSARETLLSSRVVNFGKANRLYYLDIDVEDGVVAGLPTQKLLVGARTGAYQAADGLILHTYSTSSPSCENDQTEYDSLIYGIKGQSAMNPYANANYSVEGNSQRIGIIQEYTQNLPLYITEHNIEWEVQAASDCGDRSEIFNLKAGLGVSLSFNQFIRRDIALANFHHMSANVPHGDSGAWQSVGRFNKNDIWRAINKYEHVSDTNPQNNKLYMQNLTPAYHVWRLYSQYGRGQALQLKLADNLDRRLDAMAFRKDDKIHLFITNMDALEARSVSLSLPPELSFGADVGVQTMTTKEQSLLAQAIKERLPMINGQYNMMEASNEIVDINGYSVDNAVVDVFSSSRQLQDPIVVGPHSLTVLSYTISDGQSTQQSSIPRQKYTKGVNMLSFAEVDEVDFNFLSSAQFNINRAVDPRDNKLKSKILKYNNITGQYEKFGIGAGLPADYQAFAPRVGEGYFVRVYEGEEIDQVKYNTRAEGSYTIALHEGWNLLGNPFKRDIDISALRIIHNGIERDIVSAAEAKLSTDYLWTWDRRLTATGAWRFISSNPRYNTLVANKTTTMESYSGFWLYCFVPNLQIVLR